MVIDYASPLDCFQKTAKESVKPVLPHAELQRVIPDRLTRVDMYLNWLTSLRVARSEEEREELSEGSQRSFSNFR